MKRVCFFHVGPIADFHGYSIDSLDPAPYFPQWDSSTLFERLSEAKSMDDLYRHRDRAYMRFVGDFVDKFKDYDLVVLANYNPIHPEVLALQLARPVKVMGFVDDPFSTYIRGVPYLWAFDGAFHISPSYSPQLSMAEALKLWGCEHVYWWPLVWPNSLEPGGRLWPHLAGLEQFHQRGDAFFTERDLDVIYVGGGYSTKMDRLASLKKKFGPRMQIYGRWSYQGYVGMLRWLTGKPPMWSKVSPISNEQRRSLYFRTRIGLNMHLSGQPAETGNMRMYEVPAHGMMQLCDQAAQDAQEQIFADGKEAVYYHSTDDAIAKIEYYLAHAEERIAIARAGFERVHRDYDGEAGFKKLLDWAASLPRKTGHRPLPAASQFLNAR